VPRGSVRRGPAASEEQVPGGNRVAFAQPWACSPPGRTPEALAGARRRQCVRARLAVDILSPASPFTADPMANDKTSLDTEHGDSLSASSAPRRLIRGRRCSCRASQVLRDFGLSQRPRIPSSGQETIWHRRCGEADSRSPGSVGRGQPA
jgi:hypothetical protein